MNASTKNLLMTALILLTVLILSLTGCGTRSSVREMRECVYLSLHDDKTIEDMRRCFDE